MPSAVIRPRSTGAWNASSAPWFSASPWSASIRPWLSMMPVDGESSAAVQNTSGSSAATASGSSHCRSSTPFAAALARMRFERRLLRRAGGDDELAAPRMRHAALGAIGVQAVLAGDAGARFERAGRVVDPGVDHLAVARAGLGADHAGRLEEQHLAARHRQLARRPRGRSPRRRSPRSRRVPCTAPQAISASIWSSASPRLRAASRISAQVRSSTSMPCARRSARRRRSGSPGTSTSSKPGRGRADFT